MNDLAHHLDGLEEAVAGEALLRCCGSRRWVETMLARRPFGDDEALFALADELWQGLTAEDWLEAFAAHPRIGERRPPAGGGTATASWSSQEQAGMRRAADETRQRLEEGNRRYEERFGFVFLICATGLSAETMLGELERRLTHDPETELRLAATEQAKITRLRLEKLTAEL